MRLLCPLLTATGISLSTAARSTTASGGEPHNTARYLPAVVSPSKMNASVALELVKVHGNEEGIDRDRQSDEERGELSLIPLTEVLGKAEPLIQATEHSPLSMLERLKAKAGESFERAHDWQLQEWAQKIDAYRAGHPDCTVEDEVEHLLTINPDARTLAKVFHRFRKVDGMQSRADELQRALVAKNEDVARGMIAVWLKDGVDPDVVYSMLPIALKKPSTDSMEAEAVKEWLLTWIKYVDKHAKLGGSYDDAATVTKLVDEWGKKESVDFLLSLQNTGIKPRIGRLTSTLGEKYPDTLKVMFDVWLKSNTDPLVVFDMMPIGTKGYLKSALHRRDLWEEIVRDLSQWHEYDMMHSKKAFEKSDGTNGQELLGLLKTTNHVTNQILQSNEPRDVVEFAEYLRALKGWGHLVFELERKMFSEAYSGYPPLLYEKWAAINLSPHGVFSSMPISSVRNYNPEKELAGSLERKFVSLEQLLKYVDDDKVTFIDHRDKRIDTKDKMVITLLKNMIGSASQLKAFLKDFGKRGMEDRSDRLVTALEALLKTRPAPKQRSPEDLKLLKPRSPGIILRINQT